MRLKSLVMTGLALGTLFATAAVSQAQAVIINRPAELRLGTCANVGELVQTLTHLTVTEGDALGQENAAPVEQSFTIVPYTVPQLLDVNHVVTVQAAEETPDEQVACGEIGGAMNPDGTLAAGMLSMNGSGLSGVVYFTPNPGYESTLITILLVKNGIAAAEPIAAGATEIS